MIKKDVCFSAAPSHGLAKVQLIKTAPALHPHPKTFTFSYRLLEYILRTKEVFFFHFTLKCSIVICRWNDFTISVFNSS